MRNSESDSMVRGLTEKTFEQRGAKRQSQSVRNWEENSRQRGQKHKEGVCLVYAQVTGARQHMGQRSRK